MEITRAAFAYILIGCLLAIVHVAKGQSFQMWSQYFLQLKMPKEYEFIADFGHRTAFDAEKFDTYLVRAGIAMPPNFHGLNTQFAYFENYTYDSSLKEFRWHVNKNYSISRFDQFEFKGSARGEARFLKQEFEFKSIDDPFFYKTRFRKRLDVSYHLNHNIKLTVADEFFLHLSNSVKKGVFDKNRLLFFLDFRASDASLIQLRYNIEMYNESEMENIFWLALSQAF